MTYFVMGFPDISAKNRKRDVCRRLFKKIIPSIIIKKAIPLNNLNNLSKEHIYNEGYSSPYKNILL